MAPTPFMTQGASLLWPGSKLRASPATDCLLCLRPFPLSFVYLPRADPPTSRRFRFRPSAARRRLVVQWQTSWPGSHSAYCTVAAWLRMLANGCHFPLASCLGSEVRWYATGAGATYTSVNCLRLVVHAISQQLSPNQLASMSGFTTKRVRL